MLQNGKTFLKPNHPILKKVAKKIPFNQINSEEIKKIALLMLRIIKTERKKNRKGVGLAAPQIGISKRIILVDTKANGKRRSEGNLKVYINPEIIWKSEKENEWHEGCFSIPEVCGIVERPTSIKVGAFKLKSPFVNTNPNQVWVFEPIEEKFTGYVARIFQHEIDHLDGQFFVEHISNPDHLHHVKEEEFPLYGNKQAWRNWPRKYPLPLALGKLKKV